MLVDIGSITNNKKPVEPAGDVMSFSFYTKMEAQLSKGCFYLCL